MSPHPKSFETVAADSSSSAADLRAGSRWAGASHLKLALIALAVALIVFIVTIALDGFMLTHHDSPWATAEMSDVIGAVVIGVLFYLYIHARRREVLRRLDTISLMNHHIRNALQVIAASSYMPDRQKELDAISDSVNRIQWALREILPKL